MLSPLEFINSLRESDGYIRMIYMNGGCYEFYKLLKKMYPDAKAYMVKLDGCSYYNHVLTNIYGFYYDIDGIFSLRRNHDAKEVDERVESWNFSKKKLIYKECPECGEMVCFESDRSK